MTYQYVERVSSNQEDKKDVPNLTKDIAEIELDNALYDKPVSTSSSSAMSTGTPSSLGDSGSSDSSLLGKLEDCVKTLREDHELRVIGDPALQVELSPSKNHFTATTDIKVKKTTRIDLREKETAVIFVFRARHTLHFTPQWIVFVKDFVIQSLSSIIVRLI